MKKRLFLFALIALIITVSYIGGTYALFETDATANKGFSIGQWKIEVNDVDISLAQTITLNDFTYSTTSHTEDGFFAPGRSASFDIVIDTSDCDVSVSYELEIDDSVLDDHPNIAFSITNGNTTIVSNTYSGVSYLSDLNREITLTLSLTWTDNVLYDENDTALIGEELPFNITAHFEQYIPGE